MAFAAKTVEATKSLLQSLFAVCVVVVVVEICGLLATMNKVCYYRTVSCTAAVK